MGSSQGAVGAQRRGSYLRLGVRETLAPILNYLIVSTLLRTNQTHWFLPHVQSKDACGPSLNGPM